MKAEGFSGALLRRRAWFALGLVPLLSGCLGAVALPLLAGGTLMATDKHRVSAATQVAAPGPASRATSTGKANADARVPSDAVLTSLTELPPPSGSTVPAAGAPWQQFFAYAQAGHPAREASADSLVSALLAQPPDIDSPVRAKCPARTPAVVIDLDDAGTAFVPDRLAKASADIADGLARLRQAGVVVLWISRLPAARAAEVARALRASGLDPQGQDQFLLHRNGGDRKQLLRLDANRDVCIVAIAGDQKDDFDELFDYLRNPGTAAGLYPMMGAGWFLVPSLTMPAAGGG